jgi:Tfp pilus assembly protein PilO
MMALHWHIRRGVRLLRWQGVIGLGCGIAAVALYFLAIEPGKVQIRKMESETLSIRTLAQSRADASVAFVPDREAWLEQFYGLLPAQATAPESLRMIFSAAHSQSLALEQGQYKLTTDKTGRLVTYEIVLPLRGSYVQVQKFLGDVLQRIPAIALDEITLKREAIGDPRIDASLRFTLFLSGG